MATAVKLSSVQDRFPAGTKVKAYSDVQACPASGAPSGASHAEATVAEDGSLEFTGLTEGTSYLAYASVSSKDVYLGFRCETQTAGEGFTIESTNAEDTGTVAWQIFEPAL